MGFGRVNEGKSQERTLTTWEFKMRGKKIKAGFYLELIRTVFQAVDEQGKLRNRVVAFTSATPGEGVSHVVNILAEELALQTQTRVLRVEAIALENLQVLDPSQISRHCGRTLTGGLAGLRRDNPTIRAVLHTLTMRAPRVRPRAWRRADCRARIHNRDR